MWIYYLLSLCFSRIHFFLLLHLVFLHDVRAAVKDGVKTVEVTEGATVTLRTDLTAVNSNEIIVWTFVTTDTVIAHLANKDAVPYYNKIFSDRLHLDTQTGSLTISNTRTNDSGPYKVQIISDKSSEKHFNVTVYATLPVPKITNESLQNHSESKSSSSSGCSAVCSVKNGYKVTLSWFRGSSLISITNDTDNSTISLRLDLQCCDTNTYICVAANPITNQTAQLKTSCKWSRSPSESSRLLQWLIPVLVVLLLVLVTMYLLYRKKVFSKKTQVIQSQTVQTPEEEVQYAETMFRAKRVQDMKPDEQQEIVYSTVVKCRPNASLTPV